ncbi:uncharacterized protein DUF317 [Streptomyces puniciscabiei]|uniref:Uncharacterized protein DUF317 n=1 Tax=Streptomyces puniciscabiei TaxID=164348 RepID=A0A542UIY0_9ACTN|nr:DUF317 domain-containing protein [Streptomyces puniciscabiei]TQK99027.1 uncharacterized protein DUF317 [Streptomyces puniciscabiei]
MSSDPFNNLGPDREVKVLPRHLAGPGPTDLHIAWPFPFDEDWSLHQPGTGPALASSPCLRLFTGLVPSDTFSKGKWTIAANRVPFAQPTWKITFDATTPIELLHDVHTELLDLYLEGRHSDRDRLFEDDTAPQEAYTPLLARGWSHQVKTDGTQFFRAPDDLAGVRHRYAGSDAPTWTAWGGHPDQPYWRAQFSFGTPTALVAAFTISMIATVPVSRTVKDVPFPTRDLLYIVAAATGAKQAPLSSPVATPPPGPAPRRTR